MITFYENNQKHITAFNFENLSFHSHLHKEVECLLITEGNCHACINEKEYIVSQGELLIIFPNTIHSYNNSNNNCKGSLIIFGPELFGEFTWNLTKYYPINPIIEKEKIHKDIHYCVNQLLIEQFNDNNNSLLKGYLTVILSRIFSNIKLLPINKEDFDLTHKILIFITENFKESITLDSVCKEFGTNKSYISKVFSQKIGVKFNDYINSLRIDLAQHLLENSNLSISQICFDCGFDSLRTFNRIFQKFLNCSPSEYRKNKMFQN